jgi:hypothetical protein
MDDLPLVGNRLTDVVLGTPVIRVLKAGVHDPVLHIDQEGLRTKILVLSHLQQANELLCSGGAGLDVFDLE